MPIRVKVDKLDLTELDAGGVPVYNHAGKPFTGIVMKPKTMVRLRGKKNIKMVTRKVGAEHFIKTERLARNLNLIIIL